ncbi:MAG TPA: hypothetical protein VK594_15740, partial [Streptosporangiaceae bacterium]|nr:hypothetical protein [Streptosporangiaceae bacterium]
RDGGAPAADARRAFRRKHRADDAGPALAELGRRDEARAQFDAASALFVDLNDDEGAERAESAISACGSAWSPASGAAYRGREHRRQGGNPQ